jgi:hypothetical protein
MMLLDDIKNRINERAVNQIREIDQAVAMLNKTQQTSPSVANELMLESLQYRKEKLEREAE